MPALHRRPRIDSSVFLWLHISFLVIDNCLRHKIPATIEQLVDLFHTHILKNLTILTSIKTHKMSIGLICFFIIDVDMAYQFRTKDREAAVPLPNKVWL